MSKSISKNAMFSTVLNLFNIILPILIFQIVSSTIGEELYGYIGSSDSLTSYFLIFASFGVYTYGLREMSRVRDNKIKLRQTFTSLFILTTVTNLLAVLTYMIFTVISYKNEAYFYTYILMGLNLSFNIFYVEWVNQALENYGFIAIKTVIVRIISCILTLILIKHKQDYLLYLYILIGSNFINNIISFVYIKKEIPFDFSNLQFTRHIKPMIYAVILSNVGVLYTQLDKFMIKGNIGTTDVGYYYMAQRIMNLVNTLMLTLVTVTMPRLSNYLGNDSKDEYLLLLIKIVKIYFLFLFPSSIGLACLSKEIILIFGKGAYLQAIPVLAIFSMYMLSLGVQNIISNQILYLYKKEKYDSILILLGGIINFILNILLVIIGKFTIVTAITTTLIANLIVIVLQYKLVTKIIKLDINLFAFENVKYFFYSLLFVPITIILKRYIFNSILICISDVTLCGLTYLIILTITKDKALYDILHKLFNKFSFLKRAV
ncbi:oligosaccharide flippase family protein [Clostridium uliginosum]|uniref:Membrane protein involved in the export of O-antigen and teichoic acid n=1 Tax=Clostridium uliginosum TaxID=119641 RepID=A0A1I1P1L0_9CLOT|nr:oligosaccharide flippase family protein [Clostridium uliginosum]SFD03615.1 Membrane protein involved in the export of O-antigen and teichoic acid [Clostridium uliginosum]